MGIRARIYAAAVRLAEATDPSGWREYREADKPSRWVTKGRRIQSKDHLASICERLATSLPGSHINVNAVVPDSHVPNDGIASQIEYYTRLPATRRQRLEISATVPGYEGHSSISSVYYVRFENTKTECTATIESSLPVAAHLELLKDLVSEYSVPLSRSERRTHVPVGAAVAQDVADQRMHEKEIGEQSASIGARKGGLWGVAAGVLSGVLSGVATVWATTGFPWT